MSLRDYFAAAALQGMLAMPECEGRGNWCTNSSNTDVAINAYAYADAMIAARNGGAS